jgi:hypothetical protein
MVTAKDMITTYHGYGRVDNEHIDFCFIDDKIKPLYLKTMTETVDGKYPSDHYGIYTELEI